MFHGRVRIRSFLLFLAFCLVVGVPALVYDNYQSFPITGKVNTGVATGILGLILLLPGFSFYIRRLHDFNASGWWSILSLVPLVGLGFLILLLVRTGTVGDNRFGPDPRQLSATTAKQFVPSVSIPEQRNSNKIFKRIGLAVTCLLITWTVVSLSYGFMTGGGYIFGHVESDSQGNHTHWLPPDWWPSSH
jgi:uncharacterized membrane protein YhaH (DUF805 family)